MSTRLSIRAALALLLFWGLAATALGAIMVWGVTLTPVLVLAALAGSAILLAGTARIHDAIQAWRWNAGHRLH